MLLSQCRWSDSKKSTANPQQNKTIQNKTKQNKKTCSIHQWHSKNHGNSNALAIELPQSCVKPLLCTSIQDALVLYDTISVNDILQINPDVITAYYELSQYKNTVSPVQEFDYNDNTVSPTFYIYDGNPHTWKDGLYLTHWPLGGLTTVSN